MLALNSAMVSTWKGNHSFLIFQKLTLKENDD